MVQNINAQRTLLNLPGEIRTRIYREYFKYLRVWIHISNEHDNHTVTYKVLPKSQYGLTPLHAVCKQISADIKGLPHQEAAVRFHVDVFDRSYRSSTIDQEGAARLVEGMLRSFKEKVFTGILSKSDNMVLPMRRKKYLVYYRWQGKIHTLSQVFEGDEDFCKHIYANQVL